MVQSKPVVHLSPKDNAIIQLKCNYDIKMLNNRRGSLMQSIINCINTDEAEMLVNEHNDVIQVLEELN